MDASGRRWPRADLRVGDADRQSVVAELQRHYIDGRLNSEELGERVSRALAARTFGELAEPLHDLPTLHDHEATEMDTRWQRHAPASRWPVPPIAAVLVLVGLVALLALWVLPNGHVGMFPFFPVLIWGFFFFGRPYRGRRF
jgi:uncharacterized protein DUF1707